MNLYKYDVTGLYTVTLDLPDGAPIPALTTFSAPPDFTPDDAPYAVFHDGAWFLEQVRPTKQIHSALDTSAQTIRSYQGKAALMDSGLYDTVLTVINHASTPAKAKLLWSESVDWRRGNPTLIAVAERAGISAAKMDELFILGARISADSL